MKQKQSKKDDLEIRKAPEELTEQDLERVTGGGEGEEGNGKDFRCGHICREECPSDCDSE